jgi:hypothetical protein
MATSAITRANSRRAALRRRLDARHPLFADQFYARDIAQHRAYFNGQQVAAPSHPRRRRPARRSVNRTAQQAFRVRQMDLLTWKRPSRARIMMERIVAAIRTVIQRVWPFFTPLDSLARVTCTDPPGNLCPLDAGKPPWVYTFIT